jgi:hypothetical protein
LLWDTFWDSDETATCCPATRITSFLESILTSGHGWLVPVILAALEAEIRRIEVQGPISKITRAKWTGGVPLAVERLLCKCETLSSNPRPIKKKKKKSVSMP